MKCSYHICFIGGDERQRYAAETLADYIDVNAVGSAFNYINNTHITRYENPLKAVYESKAIVLPLPAAASESIISFSEIADLITKSDSRVFLLGGKFSPYLKGIIQNYRIEYVDYYEDEVFTVKNAYLTAEGAMQLAMSAIKGSIRFSKCAVIGYGRIGSALADMLQAVGAEVTVFARRSESLVWAEEKGMKIKKIDNERLDILDTSDNYEIIFNTVPERIIHNEDLLGIPSDTVLIELASPPGGFDAAIAEQCEIKYINGGGIPGKYAPKTAGRIVGDTILNYLKKEGIL